MMKRLFAAVLILMALASPGIAKKEKTIVQQDTLVTDVKYGYSFSVNENWKVRDFKEPSIERAFLEKKNYSVNREAQAFGGDYTVPTILVYAQQFDGSLEDFEALLKKSLDEHQSDNEIIRKLNLLQTGEFVASNSARIDSLPARQIFLKRNYKRLLSTVRFGRETSGNQPTEKYINDHEVHELYVTKKDNVLFVCQAYCEREFYARENRAEFQAMANSFRF
jgi:hypothetical protein